MTSSSLLLLYIIVVIKICFIYIRPLVALPPFLSYLTTVFLLKYNSIVNIHIFVFFDNTV